MTDETITRLAAGTKVTISPEAEALVGPMMPAPRRGALSLMAMPMAITKAAIEMPMLRQVQPVEGKLAQDQTRNLLDCARASPRWWWSRATSCPSSAASPAPSARDRDPDRG